MAEMKLDITKTVKVTAEKALDEFHYRGLTIREWADKITSGEYQPVKNGRWIMVRKTKLIPTGYMAVAEGHVLTKTGVDQPFTMQEANIIPLKAHKVVKIPYCSVCGNYGDDEYDKTPYCSYCGAKMDGGDTL